MKIIPNIVIKMKIKNKKLGVYLASPKDEIYIGIDRYTRIPQRCR